MHGRYEKGIDTRKKIIAEAKIMFKEQGYDKMRISALCRNLNIQLGNFTYYFKTKTDLISEIYAEHLIRSFQTVKTAFEKSSKNSFSNKRIETVTPSMDSFQTILTVDYFYYVSIFTRPESLRFYYEVIEKMPVIDYIGRHVKRFYASHNSAYNLGFNDEELRDILLMDSAIRREFFSDMVKTYGFDITADIAIKYIDKMHIFLGRIMKMDSGTLEQYNAFAKELLSQYGFGHLDLFFIG